MRRRSVFYGVATSYRKGLCPSAPQFFGFLSIYAYTFCRRTNKFDVVTIGRGVILGVNHASHPKRAEFQGSPIYGVLLYICLHLERKKTKSPFIAETVRHKPIDATDH